MRIRHLREAYGLSIPDLVERIAAHGVTVHKDTISNIELGHRRASTRLLTAWAKALGINPLDVCQPDAGDTDDSEDNEDERSVA